MENTALYGACHHIHLLHLTVGVVHGGGQANLKLTTALVCLQPGQSVSELAPTRTMPMVYFRHDRGNIRCEWEQDTHSRLFGDGLHDGRR